MNNYAKKEFSVRLGKLRAERNLSQQELSDQTGVLRETIAKYETGKRSPSFDDLITFSKFFNTTIDYLLGLTNNKTSDMLLLSVCKNTGLSEQAVLNTIDHYGTLRKQDIAFVYKLGRNDDIKRISFNKTVHDIIDGLFDSEDPEHSPIAELVELLAHIKEDSMKYVNFCNENEEPDNFRDLDFDDYVVVKGKPDLKIYPTKHDKWQSKKNELINKADNDRYMLLQYIENLSNRLAERNDEPNG